MPWCLFYTEGKDPVHRPSPQGRPHPGGVRSSRQRGAGVTPTAAASHLAGRACPCLHSAAWDVGPETAASRSLRGPFSVRVRPHTSKCLTLSSSGSPSDLAGQRPEGPGNAAAATALQGLGPTLLGDSGGSHQKVGGSPRKETPTPVKQLTFPQSVEAPPASSSPPTLWVVRSRSRAGLWVSRKRQSCKERK